MLTHGWSHRRARQARCEGTGRTARRRILDLGTGTGTGTGTLALLERFEGSGRIYYVEPTGPLENDPDLTDKRFPGNPTRSYRTQQPLRVVGEVVDWEGHSQSAA